VKLIAIVAATLVLAGCSAAGAPGSTPPPAASSAQAVKFRIQETHCGPFTAAQQKALGTLATSGFVATVTNTGTQAGEIQISVNFVDGSRVDANNVSPFSPPLAPGQSVVVRVDNVTGAGQDGDPADTCDPVGSYERPVPGQTGQPA
jgi:hypothetical protein